MNILLDPQLPAAKLPGDDKLQVIEEG